MQSARRAIRSARKALRKLDLCYQLGRRIVDEIEREGRHLKYRWTIHTADTLYSGTSGEVYLALHGLNASMKEVLLPNPDSELFDRNQTDSGMIDVAEDLGEIDSGTVRTEGNTTGKPWNVDYVKIMNVGDGREWTASNVGACDLQGRCPLLRFVKTASAAPLPQEEEDDDDDDTGDEPGGDNQEGEPTRPDPSDADIETIDELKRQVAILNSTVESQGAELRMLRSSLGLVKGGPIFWTLEVFGRLRGRVVPLLEVVSANRLGGGVNLVPGSSICLTKDPSEGYGLAGSPGRWRELFPGVNPMFFGLDPFRGIVASDGKNAWPLSSQYLEMIFGASWRDDVYLE